MAEESDALRTCHEELADWVPAHAPNNDNTTTHKIKQRMAAVTRPTPWRTCMRTQGADTRSESSRMQTLRSSSCATVHMCRCWRSVWNSHTLVLCSLYARSAMRVRQAAGMRSMQMLTLTSHHQKLGCAEQRQSTTFVCIRQHHKDSDVAMHSSSIRRRFFTG